MHTEKVGSGSLGTPLEELGLSDRSWGALLNAGIATIEQLQALSEDQLALIDGLEPRSRAEIKIALKKCRGTTQVVAGGRSSVEPNHSEYKGVPLKELGLSTRIHNALRRGGISTLGELTTLTEEQVLQVRNLGELSLKEIQAALAEHELDLRQVARPLWSELAKLADELTRQTTTKIGESDVVLSEDSYRIPIEVLELPTRPRKALKRHGVLTVGELLDLSQTELQRIRNIGEGSLRKIEFALDKLGLSLGRPPTALPPKLQEATAKFQLPFRTLDQIVAFWLQNLSRREIQVISYRYGFSGVVLTIEETADLVEVSPSQLSRIEQVVRKRLVRGKRGRVLDVLASILQIELHHSGGLADEAQLGQAIEAKYQLAKIDPTGVARLVLDVHEMFVQIPGESTWGLVNRPLSIVPRLRELLSAAPLPISIDALLNHVRQSLQRGGYFGIITEEFLAACIKTDPQVQMDSQGVCDLIEPGAGIVSDVPQKPTLDILLKNAIRGLTRQERDVMGHRYGLTGSPLGVEEVATHLEITSEQVLRAEQKALEKLKRVRQRHSLDVLADILVATLHQSGGLATEAELGQAIAAEYEPRDYDLVGIARLVVRLCDQAAPVPGERTWGLIELPTLLVGLVRRRIEELLSASAIPSEHLLEEIRRSLEQSGFAGLIGDDFINACIRTDPYIRLDQQEQYHLQYDEEPSVSTFREPSLDLLTEVWLSPFSERNAEIMRYRYGIRNGESRTLEECGQKFDLSRERIRQIQYKCLNRLAHPSRSFLAAGVIRFLHKTMQSAGGLMTEEETGASLSERYEPQTVYPVAVGRLLLSISGKFSEVPKESTWKLADLSLRRIRKVRGEMIRILEQRFVPTPLSDLIDAYRETARTGEDESDIFLYACLRTDPAVLINDGRCGLEKWRRTRADEITLALHELGEAAHYSEIAERVNTLLPSHSRTSAHNIHAELGRRTDLFVRVGHGIFGLKEWGLPDDGNLGNAAHRVLNEAERPLHIEEIADRVMETWCVERSSVQAAIYNDDRFYRAAPATFGLIEWEIERLDEKEPVLNVCPLPLSDRRGERNTFFESVLVARNILQEQPKTANFVKKMLKWIGTDLEKSNRYCQNMLNLYYLVGLIPYTVYRRALDIPLQSCLLETDDLQSLRRFCLHCVIGRLARMNELLALLVDRQPCTRPQLRDWFCEPGAPLDEVKNRVWLLHNVGILYERGNLYRLTPLGMEIVQELQSAGKLESSLTQVPWKQTSENQPLWDDGFDIIDLEPL